MGRGLNIRDRLVNNATKKKVLGKGKYTLFYLSGKFSHLPFLISALHFLVDPRDVYMIQAF